MCCWYDYWNIAPGPADGSGQDFLAWFLQQVQGPRRRVRAAHARRRRRPLLPAVRRVQRERRPRDERPPAAQHPVAVGPARTSTSRGSRDADPLHPPHARDRSSAPTPARRCMISEWNFGADEDINGALAIAEVLGIYGREGVYAAAYWRNPPVGSPGFLAFTMHGNYDGAGARFGGDVVPAESSDLGTSALRRGRRASRGAPRDAHQQGSRETLTWSVSTSTGSSRRTGPHVHATAQRIRPDRGRHGAGAAESRCPPRPSPCSSSTCVSLDRAGPASTIAPASGLAIPQVPCATRAGPDGAP